MGQRQEVAILVSVSNYTYKSNFKCTNLLDAGKLSTFITFGIKSNYGGNNGPDFNFTNKSLNKPEMPS